MRVVTIDGPAGAGKSTVSKRLSGRLGWRLLDTGAMYRAVAWAALRRGVDLGSGAGLTTLAESLEVRFVDGRIHVDGEDIAEAIRTPEVTAATRHPAGCAGVRSCLVAWQRAFAAEQDTVTEGRDQGTVVFPDAPRKFFLTASPEERARRRHAEFAARGGGIAYETVLADLKARDASDEARVIGPLVPAIDARIVDSTGLDVDALTELIVDDLRQHGILDDHA